MTAPTFEQLLDEYDRHALDCEGCCGDYQPARAALQAHVAELEGIARDLAVKEPRERDSNMMDRCSLCLGSASMEEFEAWHNEHGWSALDHPTPDLPIAHTPACPWLRARALVGKDGE